MTLTGEGGGSHTGPSRIHDTSSPSSDAGSPLPGAKGHPSDGPSTEPGGPGDIRGRWTPKRLGRAAILVELSVFGVIALVGIYLIGSKAGSPGFDALCYWDFDIANPYAGRYGGLDFSYAPPMAAAFLPFHLLSFDAFRVVWLAIQVAALVWLARRYTLALLLFVPISVELYNGNIHLLLAVAIALAFRWPAVWSFVLLTKVTPGVALLWYVVRREWGGLAVALGATAGISLATMVVLPNQWLLWAQFLVSNPSPSTSTFHITLALPIRLVAAALIVVWGARTNRRWTVPVSAVIALPVMWINGLAVLAAVLPLMRDERAAAERARPSAASGWRSWTWSRLALKRADARATKP